MTFRKSTLLLIGLSMIAALVACSSSSHTTPPPVITVTLSSVPSTLTVNSTTAITATTNDTAGVKWSCTPAASCGTFNPTATLTGVATSYTAPSSPTTNVIITATSVTTNTISASTPAITIAAATTITVTLSTVPSTLTVNSTTAITATTNDTAGVKWSCTPAASCGTFNPTATLTGVATSYTAPSSPTTNVIITATSVTTNTISASTPAITIAAATTLADGTYVFSLAGEDLNSNYYVAGVITIAGGLITGGEQNFADILHDRFDGINPTGSSIASTADGNLQITLVTCTGTCPSAPDPVIGPGGNGIETLNGTILPLSTTGRTFITEFDASASGSGELAPQDATAAAATPTGGYAFVLNGYDPLTTSEVVGGIINVDNAGGTVGSISGTGSIFDVNDGGTLSPGQTFANTSSVSGPDPFGRVTFTLNSTNFSEIGLAGYIVDANHIRLVETHDSYGGTLGGVAYSQNGTVAAGGFTSANVAGTYVIGMTGFDTTPSALQVVNQLTLAAGPPTAVTGFLDYNDLNISSGISATSPDPITPATYTLDASGAGDVTIAGITDSAGTVTYNLQLYLDGNGHALAISMDASDFVAGVGFTQGAGPFTSSSFTGPYALDVTGYDGTSQNGLDGVGPVSATGSGETISGTVDLNWLNSSGPTYPATAVSGTFVTTGTGNSNGIFTGTITGVDVQSCIIVGIPSCKVDNFSYYLIDATGDNIAIETDENQLTLGYFLQQ